MNKGKLYKLGIIASFVALLVGSYFIVDKQVEAAEKVVVREGEAHAFTFNEEIAQERLTDGASVVILNEKGESVGSSITLDKSGKTLTIKGLPTGKYTLSIKSDAYVKATKLHRDREISIEVVATVKQITSQEDLKSYFEAYIAMEQVAAERWEQNALMSETESSSNTATQESKSDSGRGSSGDFSTTNNQVDGIEEGDMSVTDGKYIYTLSDNRIIIIDAENLKVVKRLTVTKNAYPTNLMLHKHTLIVTYSDYVELQREPYYDGKSVTKIVFYDVTDAKNPKLIREVGQDGDMMNVRKSGNFLYVVSSRTPNYWMMSETPNLELRPATYEDGKEKLLPFDQIRILPESNQPSYLLVSAIDVDNVTNAKWTTESFLGNSGQLYMSKNAIYIAGMNYNWLTTGIAETTLVDEAKIIAPPVQENETKLYKIKVDQTKITLAGEGKVKGSVLNQFSMDEHNGYFRIATTEGNSWGATTNSKNHLFILDGNLKQVGVVSDLAKGERIYSARFVGDKAYLVTFKETDPLFVIDTKNPAAPKVLGELKIPGFSNYLHPIDENHLLGIGYDTEVRMEEGSKEPIVLTGGMKLSLFDITDFSQPKEQQSVVIGGRGTYSNVQYDHKALFRDPRNHYFGFPITVYQPADDEDQDRLKYEGTGANIYKVTADGITLTAELIEKARPGEQYEDSYNTVQRILYVGDQLFTVSRSKITSYNGKTFEKQQMIGF
ncbi:hypothetical protein DCE79_01540 [Lysinibacillus sp. 2017]|uniref:beta-propeller domain-containing protein n=1 Tax=unclassified Lysinibacillus TaxID=2636778 RepID=UPI000D52A7FB|nr:MULTISPECIES: beta-propeller domain-containing protein [unclassified Lysinibacillus]AWE06146.1 hypothetical protein DCE79_01540 [Lysinibacillus sp. 2017]TGN35199.1 hypothetical protein E4L99_11090 [Lysinibacillus sp. S2017]